MEQQSDKKLNRIWDITFVFVLGYFMFSCYKNVVYVLNSVIDEYSKIPYVLDYRVEGFIRRGFIGTMINLISPGMAFDEKMKLARVMLLIAAALCIVMLILIVLKIPAQMRRYAVMLLLLLLVSPGFTSYFGTAFCRLDIYVFLIGLVCDYLIIIDKACFLIPIFCGIAMSIHTAFAFLVFPIVFILLGIRAFLLKKSEKREKKYIIVLILSTLVVIGLFVYFAVIYKRIAPVTAEELTQIILEESDGKITYCYNFVYELVFAEIKGEINAAQSSFHEAQIIATVLNISRCILLMVMYAFVSSRLMKKFKSDKISRIISRLLPCTILIISFMYFSGCDYGRWNTHLISMLFTGTLGMICFIDIDDLKALLENPKNKKIVLLMYFILVFTVGFMERFGILY